MPLYLVSAYLYCDACGILPVSQGSQGRQAHIYARADGGWQLPQAFRFVEETTVVCSDTCAFRLAEARELEAKEEPLPAPRKALPAPRSHSLECKGCAAWCQRFSEQFWILPPGWIDVEPRLPYLLCPRCTANPQKLAEHRQKAAEWLRDYDPY